MGVVIPDTTNEHAWFSKAQCAAFLGVGIPYFDRDIRSRVPADQIQRRGKSRNGPLLFFGPAVYKVAASRTGSVTPHAGAPTVAGDASYGGPDRAEADRRKALEDAALKRIKRLILEGQYVLRDLHRRSLLTYALLVRDKVEEMVEGLPAALEAQPVGKIRFLLQDWYDRFCETMQSVNRVVLPEMDVLTGEEGPAATSSTDVHAGRRSRGGIIRPSVTGCFWRPSWARWWSLSRAARAVGRRTRRRTS